LNSGSVHAQDTKIEALDLLIETHPWLFGRPMSKQDALANGPRYEPGLQSRNIA